MKLCVSVISLSLLDVIDEIFDTESLALQENCVYNCLYTEVWHFIAIQN